MELSTLKHADKFTIKYHRLNHKKFCIKFVLENSQQQKKRVIIRIFLGKFENGIYEALCPSDIEEVRIREVDFFQDSIKSDLVSGFSEKTKNNLPSNYQYTT